MLAELLELPLERGPRLLLAVALQDLAVFPLGHRLLGVLVGQTRQVQEEVDQDTVAQPGQVPRLRRLLLRAVLLDARTHRV